MTSPIHRSTDRFFLQQQAYADSTKLRARASIYAYRDPPGPIGPWVLGLVDWPEGGRAVDVGCGPGSYLSLLRELHPSVRAIGVDLSAGMAAEARQHAPTMNADTALLPVPDESVDRVLAPHMLYHCADIPAAIAELRRVLRSDGVLVAVTNAFDHLEELWDVHAAATGERPPLVSDRFNLTTGRAPLDAAFDEVRLERFEGAVAVPDAAVLVEYVASMQHFAGVDADEVLQQIGERVQRVIDDEGVFRIRTRSGAFVCR